MGTSYTSPAGDILTFPQLIMAYLSHLQGRAGHTRSVRVASQWIAHLPQAPTRGDLLARHTAKGHGHFQPGAAQANKELALVRASCRWGSYYGRWTGGDPTAGIRKWKTPKRKRIGKFDELRKALQFFDDAETPVEIRDRALFGLQLFTGCRTGEARQALVESITPYGRMGAWKKGQTKTGETHEVPLPWQVMTWIAAWKATRLKEHAHDPSPYLFIGQWSGLPLSDAGVRLRWSTIRSYLGIQGLWTYDLRRTMSCYMSNELNYDDHTIRAILNHYDGTALGRYCFKSFDALTVPLQHYADWLWALKGKPCYAPDPPRSSTSTHVYARLSVAPVRLALDDQAERMLGPVPVLPLAQAVGPMVPPPDVLRPEWPG